MAEYWASLHYYGVPAVTTLSSNGAAPDTQTLALSSEYREAGGGQKRATIGVLVLASLVVGLVLC